MIRALGRLLAWPLLGLVSLYRIAISPWLGNNCRFQPSCSAYAIEALRSHGAFRGCCFAARRIARCHPWGGSGYDPVAENDEQPVESDEQRLKERNRALNHAYGFISRGNRAGGLTHIYQCIDADPDPTSAWPWFTEQLLRWEISEEALPFAQQYLSRLLHSEQPVAAVKLMLRCRSINEAFRPLPEDRALALEAAENSQNDDLISFLR